MVDALSAMQPPTARHFVPPPGGRPHRPKASAIMGTFAHHIDLTKAFFDFNVHILYGTTLSLRQRGILVLRLAAVRRSPYLWAQDLCTRRRLEFQKPMWPISPSDQMLRASIRWKAPCSERLTNWSRRRGQPRDLAGAGSGSHDAADPRSRLHRRLLRHDRVGLRVAAVRGRAGPPRTMSPRPHGQATNPSYCTSHVPSFGKPGAGPSAPSQPPIINETAARRPPLPGR